MYEVVGSVVPVYLLCICIYEYQPILTAMPGFFLYKYDSGSQKHCL